MLQSVTAGVEHLPFAELTPGLTVCANTGAWAGPLAEWCLGAVIALGKEFMTQRQRLAQGKWIKPYTYLFRGRTLGVIGFGGIGQAVANALKPLNMSTMALNRSGQSNAPLDFIGTLKQLDKLLAQSDVVVISTPLTKETFGLIGADQLALMKDDAILINLARGAIVDQDALYAHMAAHPDFKYGADVWWDEPTEGEKFKLNHPLFELPNVLGTPHNADHVKGALPEAAKIAAQNAARFIKGEPLKGLVEWVDYV